MATSDYTLSRADFIVSTAEAANSCLRGDIAAFGPGEFHRVFGGGSKFMLPWAILLPLVMVHLAQREGSRMRPDWATSNLLWQKLLALPQSPSYKKMKGQKRKPTKKEKFKSIR